jgi:hypothetical protein
MAPCLKRSACDRGSLATLAKVIGWVAKMYYLELRRASEGTLSLCFRLYLQSFEHTPVSRRVDVSQAVFLTLTLSTVIPFLPI